MDSKGRSSRPRRNTKRGPASKDRKPRYIDALIVGGGLSGLVMGARLGKRNKSFILLERKSKLGGMIQTTKLNGYRWDMGFDGFSDASSVFRDLLDELNLGKDLLPIEQNQASRYLLQNGAFKKIPKGFHVMGSDRVLSILTSGIMSTRAKIAFLKERRFRPTADGAARDESVLDFATRHFGQEVAENVIAPLMAARYLQDSDHLSVQAALPQLQRWEKEYGSISKGLLKDRSKPPAEIDLTKPELTFRKGMGQLIERLIDKIPTRNIRTSTRATSVRRRRGCWEVQTGDGEVFKALNLILACPLPDIAPMLEGRNFGKLKDSLSEFRSGTLGVTVLVMPKNDVTKGPVGCALVVPKSENLPLLGCRFIQDGHIKKGENANHVVKLYFDPSGDAKATEEKAIEAFKNLFGLKTHPDIAHTKIWRNALPQFDVGHTKRIETLQNRLKDHRGLYISNSGLEGTGIPRAAEHAIKVAHQI